MKTLIASIVLIITSTAFASDVNVYGDAYRFGEPNYTGVAGFEINKYTMDYSFSTGDVSIGKRHYIGFTNIEIGVHSTLTTGHNESAPDWRVIDIEGGFHYIAKPYVKIGDKMFATVMIDETNTAVIRAGFELW